MQKTLRLLLIAAMLSSVAPCVFAEDPGAPVYDADSLAAPQATDEASSEPAVNTEQQPAQELKPQRVEEAPLAASNTNATEETPKQSHSQGNNLQTADSNSKAEELQTEVQTLRGQVDELTHQLQKLQAKQTEQQESADNLEKRFSKMSANKPQTDVADNIAENPKPKEAPKVAAPSNTDVNADLTTAKAKQADDVSVQQDTSEEQKTYQTAYDLIKAKKYNDAIAALQKMLQKYPTGPSAANAHYWLGELYGLTGKNDQSAQEFSTIIKDFPQSTKVSDAQLKLGMIYSAELKWPQAKAAFKKVTSGYPGTASARLAQEQLKEIKQAGH